MARCTAVYNILAFPTEAPDSGLSSTPKHGKRLRVWEFNAGADQRADDIGGVIDAGMVVSLTQVINNHRRQRLICLPLP